MLYHVFQLRRVLTLVQGSLICHLLHIHLNFSCSSSTPSSQLTLVQGSLISFTFISTYLLFPAGEHKELLSELMIIRVEMLNTKQHNNYVFAKLVQLCAFLNRTTPRVITNVANTTIFIQRHSFNNAAGQLPKTTIKHYQY